MWLDLEKVGKARRNESLWDNTDGRWLNLETIMALDFAALPELFDALTDDRSLQLASVILGKRPSRRAAPAAWGSTETTKVSRGPQLVDLEPGFKHTEPIVLTWVAKTIAYYEGNKADVMPFLEKAAKSEDAKVSAAATETIEQLNAK